MRKLLLMDFRRKVHANLTPSTKSIPPASRNDTNKVEYCISTIPFLPPCHHPLIKTQVPTNQPTTGEGAPSKRIPQFNPMHCISVTAPSNLIWLISKRSPFLLLLPLLRPSSPFNSVYGGSFRYSIAHCRIRPCSYEQSHESTATEESFYFMGFID